MRSVLAYTGSVEGSAAIAWLRECRGVDVVTVTVDVGQGRELEAIRDRALALGAHRAHVLDARDQFAQDFVVPSLRADVLHAGRVPLARALSRPLIASKLVEIARIERTDHVAHTGLTSSDESRLDRLIRALAPDLHVTAVARERTLNGAPSDSVLRNTHISQTSPRSECEWGTDESEAGDVNLWGRSFTVRAKRTSPIVPRPVDTCPTEPAIVDITFVEGVPTALNGVAMPLVELIGSLGTLASTHGVGLVQSESLVCDAPAALVLHAAHRDLTHAAVTPEVEQFSAAVRAAYVDVIERAQWFSPLRDALDGYLAAAQTPVSGRVRMRFFTGAASTVTTELQQSSTRERVGHAAL